MENIKKISNTKFEKRRREKQKTQKNNTNKRYDEYMYLVQLSKHTSYLCWELLARYKLWCMVVCCMNYDAWLCVGMHVYDWILLEQLYHIIMCMCVYIYIYKYWKLFYLLSVNEFFWGRFIFVFSFVVVAVFVKCRKQEYCIDSYHRLQWNPTSVTNSFMLQR